MFTAPEEATNGSHHVKVDVEDFEFRSPGRIRVYAPRDVGRVASLFYDD